MYIFTITVQYPDIDFVKPARQGHTGNEYVDRVQGEMINLHFRQVPMTTDRDLHLAFPALIVEVVDPHHELAVNDGIV